MCYKCGKQFYFHSPVSRSDVCPSCGSDIRCCKNCKHFSLGSHYDCKEHVEELIVSKERANFCDWFSLDKKRTSSSNSHTNNAKTQFNALFGD